MIYFALALVLAIGLAIFLANSRERDRLEAKLAEPTYNPRVYLDLKTTPVFQNSGRVWVGSHLAILLNAASEPEDTTKHFTALATEQIYLWALDLKEPREAFSSDVCGTPASPPHHSFVRFRKSDCRDCNLWTASQQRRERTLLLRCRL